MTRGSDFRRMSTTLTPIEIVVVADLNQIGYVVAGAPPVSKVTSIVGLLIFLPGLMISDALLCILIVPIPPASEIVQESVTAGLDITQPVAWIEVASYSYLRSVPLMFSVSAVFTPA